MILARGKTGHLERRPAGMSRHPTAAVIKPDSLSRSRARTSSSAPNIERDDSETPSGCVLGRPSCS